MMMLLLKGVKDVDRVEQVISTTLQRPLLVQLSKQTKALALGAAPPSLSAPPLPPPFRLQFKVHMAVATASIS
jgi:hypothetical protein